MSLVCDVPDNDLDEESGGDDSESTNDCGSDDVLRSPYFGHRGGQGLVERSVAVQGELQQVSDLEKGRGWCKKERYLFKVSCDLCPGAFCAGKLIVVKSKDVLNLFIAMAMKIMMNLMCGTIVPRLWLRVLLAVLLVRFPKT
jgi:hypothetical protein